jgi:flagellar biosynthesis/type III secretory pathway protein FliH
MKFYGCKINIEHVVWSTCIENCFVIYSSLTVKAYSKIFSERKAQKMVKTSAQILFEQGEQEGKRKGKKEGLAEGLFQGEIIGISKMVLKAIQTKFGKVPQTVKQSIRNTSDPAALESLMMCVLHSETLDEFIAASEWY